MKDNLWIIVVFCIQLCGGQTNPLKPACVMPPIHKFPYTAHVTKHGQLHCMGIIMSNQVILTTAHCTFRDHNDDEKYYKVYVGSSKIRQREGYDVCDIKPHPYFHRRGKHSSFYDIGLIILKHYIRFENVVNPVRLLSEARRKTINESLSIASFGFTKSIENPTRLCLTNMKYLDQTSCNRSAIVAKSMTLPAQMLCMTATGNCYADPGSAVSWNGFVVGMVVTDTQCNDKTMPTIFLNITPFKKWILNTIRMLRFNNCTSIKKHKKSSEKKISSIVESPENDDWTIKVLPIFE